MRYWGYFVAKLIAAAAAIYGLWQAVLYWFPKPGPSLYYRDPFIHDLPYTFRVLLFGLLCVGVLYVIVWDQRYRCRTCLRRLRMPVATGSWNNMVLFGPPKTEYICIYGHGTLRVPEVQISGLEMSNWQPHEDMWTELSHVEESRK